MFLFILDQVTSYTPGAISLHDGQTHTPVVLSSLNNSYCLVAQPFSESKLVSGHCRVVLDRTTRAVQGRWSVILGIPGRVSELQVDMTVAVEGEFCTGLNIFYTPFALISLGFSSLEPLCFL